MKKLLSILLVLTMLLSLMAGCGSIQSTSEASESTAEAISSDMDIQNSEAPIDEAISDQDLPLTTSGESLSMWLPLTPDLSSTYSDLNEHLAIQEAETETGVHINFIHTSFDTAAEQFNLMAASGSYCDMLSCAVKYYSTGATGALEDGLIINLADYIEEYAPDYYALINSDAEHIVQSRNDDGQILAFLGWTDEHGTFSGLMTRGDWLDELGLQPPETYEEYEETLLAYVSAYDCSAALQMYPSCLLTGSWLCGGYGISGFFTDYTDSGEQPNVMFQIDGTVYCSLLEDGYYDYISMLNRWYSEGLISKDFLSGSCNPNDENNLGDIYSGNSGIWYSECSNIANYTEAISVEGAYLVALHDAVLEHGDVSHFGGNISLGSSSGFTTSISTGCGNIELAVQWCNFWFTEAGQLLALYGLEGISYEINDTGEPVYTDLILNNADGLSVREAKAAYTTTQFPTLSTKALDMLSFDDAQLSACAIWEASVDGTWGMPDVSLTVTESERYSTLISDINTYAASMICKMVVGDEPLENWDAFESTLLSMGVEECIDIYQSALNRYNAR